MIEQSEWIRRDIDISSFYDKLSKIVKTLIAEAKEAEKNRQDFAFYEICDNIEIQAKLLVPDVISHKEWELLCEKYYPVVE